VWGGVESTGGDSGNVRPPPISTGGGLLTIYLFIFHLRHRSLDETLGVIYIGVFRLKKFDWRRIEANQMVDGETGPGGVP
jgi:hypothetical protein